jgi:putative colanic acid biosynthesis acetyltransferase WcaF
MNKITTVLNKNKIDSPVFSLKNKMHRLIWIIIWNLLVRYSPVFLKNWRNLIYRCFGADIGENVNIYPSSKVWYPKNLAIQNNSTIGPSVHIYNQGRVSIGHSTIISQNSHVCASTHDYNDALHPLLLKPIFIGNDVWICSDAFIGPGVSIADGTVIGARAVMTKNSDPWSVYAGNPCRKVNVRKNFRE